MIFSAVTDSIDEKCITAFGGNLCIVLKRFIAQSIYSVYKDKLQNCYCNQFYKY